MALGDKIYLTTDLGEHVLNTTSRTSGAALTIFKKIGVTTNVPTPNLDIFDSSTTLITDDVRIGFILRNTQSSTPGRLVTSSKIEVNGVPFLWTSFNGSTDKTTESGEEVFVEGLVDGRITNRFDLTLPIVSLTSLDFTTTAIKASGSSGGVQFEMDMYLEGDLFFTVNVFNQSVGLTPVTQVFDSLLPFLTNLPSIYSTL